VEDLGGNSPTKGEAKDLVGVPSSATPQDLEDRTASGKRAQKGKMNKAPPCPQRWKKKGGKPGGSTDRANAPEETAEKAYPPLKTPLESGNRSKP